MSELATFRRARRWVPLRAVAALSLFLLASPAALPVTAVDETVPFKGQWSQTWVLEEGEVVELSVRLLEPGALPPNGRVEVEMVAPRARGNRFRGKRNAAGVEATTGWTKVLHALDPDLHMVYKAGRRGAYMLRLKSVEQRAQPLGALRGDSSLAATATPLPTRTPKVGDAQIKVTIDPVTALASEGIMLEAEPNNAPEQAVVLPIGDGEGDEALRVIGGADEIEYFNNTQLGSLPDDWYKIQPKGESPRFLSANLQLIDPAVGARIRFYKEGAPSADELKEREVPNPHDVANINKTPYVYPPAAVIPGPASVYTYDEGRSINEPADSYRTFVTRKLEPGQTYYLRVEANQPHYELHVRLFDPAPYDEPQRAVQQAVNYQLAETGAWLMDRPRDLGHRRRVRDSASLYGSSCMGCHTLSGVWGVADAINYGYSTDGYKHTHRQLVTAMYESLRPTNDLKDALVNTSVAPNDLGNGPAGSRVSGRSIVLHERYNAAKLLQANSLQQVANYVLQTDDPSAIDDSGRGSSHGQNVVLKYAGEILERVWRKTGEPRYFFGLQDKGRRMLASGDDVAAVDDYAHRIEFFYRTWPSDYTDQVTRLTNSPERTSDAGRLQYDFAERVLLDVERLLALQRDDGGWGFDPGKADGDGWAPADDDQSYPGATAVALLALEAAGRKADDPAVAKGVQWMLQNQRPNGHWSAASATGFETTAYAIRALARLHPYPSARETADFKYNQDESFFEMLAKARQAQATDDLRFVELYFAATHHPRPQIRIYGLLGLGGARAPEALPTLIARLDDPVKSCREAAAWALRQLLLDGVGWDAVAAGFREGSERARQAFMQALDTRASLAGPGLEIDEGNLVDVLTAGMVDPFAGVRAYAFKAAWKWWVWNPAIREPLNRAWVDALLRTESDAQVEMALRYSTVALVAVNGQLDVDAGGEGAEQLYPELAGLFAGLAARREAAPALNQRIVDRRLAALAASYQAAEDEERANLQGPWQFGYGTSGATELFGKAVQSVYSTEEDGDIPWKSIAAQAGRSIPYEPLQEALQPAASGP